MDIDMLYMLNQIHFGYGRHFDNWIDLFDRNSIQRRISGYCVLWKCFSLKGLYIEGFLSAPDAIFAENPGGEIVPGPGKFFTNAVFAFGAAWSPNPDNPPYMVDLPIDEFGAIRPDIVQKWLNHDPFSMLDDPLYLNNIKSLKGIYLDAGLQDELGMNAMADAFSTKLTAFAVTHTYENFDGGHFSKLFSRLEISFKYCSDSMD